jgi:predicted nucleotidyltransferase component of viral defense system
MFEANNPFLPQARLVVRVLRQVAEEPSLALKGGTAINLFFRELPRLSVDIDLAYAPVRDRDQSLAEIGEALRRIARRAEDALPGARVRTQEADRGKLVAQEGRARVTVEVNTVLRGSVYPCERRVALPVVEELFGDVEAQVLSFEDVFAGKIVAALDRQHPRDLFDVKLLLDEEGLSERLLDAFAIYLASHDRPIAEVLEPREKDIRAAYEREFAQMTAEPIALDNLLDARRRLVVELRGGLQERHREFLRSVKRLAPDWSLLPVPHASELPGIRWKLRNLEILRREQPARYAAALANLEGVLDTFGR